MNRSTRRLPLSWYLGIFSMLWLIPCAIVLLEVRYGAGMELTLPFAAKALAAFFLVALSGIAWVVVITRAKYGKR